MAVMVFMRILLLLAALAVGAWQAQPRPAKLQRACLRLGRNTMVHASEDLGLDFLVTSDGSNDVAASGSFTAGAQVRVREGTGLVLFHVPGHPSLDPGGLEGEVVRIITGVSANRPIAVKFTTPKKFTAHFSDDELDAL